MIDVFALDLANIEDPSPCSDADFKRAQLYKFETDQRRFLSARAQMRRILGERLGVSGPDIDLHIGPDGRPSIPGQPIDFNMSRTGDVALLTVGPGQGPLGVDIEQIVDVPELDDIGAQNFSQIEQNALFGCSGSARRGLFYRIWTAKEALTKATGEGLSANWQGFSVSVSGVQLRLVEGSGLYHPAKWALDMLDVGSHHVAALARPAGSAPARLMPNGVIPATFSSNLSLRAR